jgi:hypothetical protein
MVMRYLLVISAILTVAVTAIAQKYDYTWILGYEPLTGYDPDSMIGLNKVNLEKGFEQSMYIAKYGSLLNTNASICHPETGDLLMYFDGCRIFNRDFEIMENGDSLFHGIWWKEWCDSGTKSYSGHRSGLILSFIQDSSKYMVVHTRDSISPKFIYNQELRYSIVEFNEGDYGKVISKAKTIYKDSTYLGFLHAARHPDGIGWWVLSFAYHGRDEFLLSYVSLDTVYKHSAYKFQDFQLYDVDGGALVFNSYGDKIVFSTLYEGVHLFDFDRNTGLISNHRIWLFPDSMVTFRLTVQFSPNGRYLYVTNTLDLWQIDTWAEDLNAGTVYIAEWDGLTIGGFFRTAFGEMVIGPDCKIYMGTSGTTRYLHVIHHPDLPGQACGFDMRGITLKSVNGHAMPLFPNYRLDLGPVCDPTLTTAEHTVLVATTPLEVFPNPATSEVHVRLADSPLGGQMAVYDVTGREVYRHGWPGEQHRFSVSGWPSGLYFINYYSAEGRYASGRVVVE